MTRVGPERATCSACGQSVPIVNYTPPQGRHTWTGGYLAAHHRPGTRAETKCRGWKSRWVEGSVVVSA